MQSGHYMGGRTGDDLYTTRRWVLGGLVSLLGVATLGIPLFDIWEDTTQLSWSLLASLAENSLLLALSLGIVGTGVWLVRREWDPRYLTVVVKWSYSIVGGVIVLYGIVVAIQLWSMHQLKPFVLLADGVLFVAVTAVAVGVTSARQRWTTDTLRESEERHRTLTEDVLDTSDVATFILDDDFSVVWINEATATYFDLDRTDIIGQDKRTLVDDQIAEITEQPERFADLVTSTYDDNTYTENFECHVLSGDGREERWLEHWSRPITSGLYEGGRIEHYTDVTRQKRAQAELEDREAKLRQMYDLISDPGRGFEGKVEGLISVGRSLFDAEFGAFARIDPGENEYQLEVVQSESIDLRDGDVIPYTQTHCQRMVAADRTVQFETRPFESTPEFVDDVGDFEFGDDVGDFEFGDEERTTARDYGTDEEFEMYVGTPVSVDGENYGALCFLDREGSDGFEEWQLTLVELMGSWIGYELARNQLLEEHERQLEESEARFESIVETVDEYAIFTVDADGNVQNWNEGAREILGYERDEVVGTPVTSLSPEAADDPDEILARARREGRITYEGWRHRKDGTQFYADVSISTRHDATNTLAGYTVIVRDTTEQRTYQQTIEHERERLEFMNRFVRHNILNGLNVINARADVLRSAIDESEDVTRHLDLIDDRVADMSNLVGTIRTFMNAVLTDADHELQPTSLREVLERKVDLARESYDAEFDVHGLPSPSSTVEADGLLGEVFENVLSNAVIHNDEETPHVEVWATKDVCEVPHADQPDGAPVVGAAIETEQQEVLTVHVADDGPGISDDEKEAILEKGASRFDEPGHGFGLYLVREMMETYGGEIDIRDNQPKGTVFDLSFPLADAEEG